ncbi:nitrogen fixation protein NifQ [Vibrio olivae]|uniref:Nitrogen fixation protein NifQ n=1 Tax=Vibrio olivae TaxID=1243002 RepID=A0ABV5HMH5_9VIBR
MGTQLCSVTEISDYRYHEQKIWKALIGGFITGRSALPPAMGLDHAVFNTLKNQMLDVGIFEVSEQQKALHQQTQQLFADLIEARSAERDDLYYLLIEHADTDLRWYKEVAWVLANASMSSYHLWQSLGLDERPTLGKLIAFYFPTLHAGNVNNMRWKRYFYKQLCERGGDYLCKAPNCSQCSSFKECFV